MKKSKGNQILIDEIKKKKLIISNKKIIKRCSNFDSILLIDKRKDRLTKSYYAFAEEIILTEFNDYLAIVMKNYEPEYQTFWRMVQKDPIDKNKVFLAIFKILKEMNSINIDFYDVHSENFLVNKKNKVKVVDLDSSYIGVSWYSKQMQLLNLLQMIFEIYLFQEFKKIGEYLEFTRKQIDVYKYFSKEYSDYIMRKEKRLIDEFQFASFLEEMEDQEKMETIKKELKKGNNNLLLLK